MSQFQDFWAKPRPPKLEFTLDSMISKIRRDTVLDFLIDDWKVANFLAYVFSIFGVKTLEQRAERSGPSEIIKEQFLGRDILE